MTVRTVRDVRETRLYLDAVVRILGQEEVERNIGSWQFENEAPIDMLDNRKDLPAQAFQAIRALWSGRGKLVTLEDLTSFTGEEVADLPGVGPKAMTMLDTTMTEHGLGWAGVGSPTGAIDRTGVAADDPTS